MFKDIDKHEIKIRNSKKNTLTYLPNIISMNPVDELLEATKWLVDEAYKDWENTHNSIKERTKEKGASQENIDEWETLSIRLGSRTQGYVNQLCLVEDILIFEYKRMNELLTEASNGKIVLDPKKDYAELRKRFEPIRTFRNKVVAHTAYTYSKPEDNPETIIRSILNLFPSPAEITIGGNFFSGFSEHKSQIPVITIFGWYEQIEPIFKDWKKLFLEKLDFVCEKLPLENKEYKIEIAYPHIYYKNKTKK